jgi:thiol-disulfide isomerase/thioredoxin
MKKYFFPAVIAIIVLIVVSTICFFYLNNRYNNLELLSEEIIPSRIDLYNASGEVSSISDIKSNHKVVFYLESMNEDCIHRLDCISKMIDLLSFEGMSYMLIWEDQIPLKQINEAGIDESYNYSLNGKASLSEWKPTAFLTDENNKIKMVTGFSYVTLINEVIKISNKDDLCAKAVDKILKNALQSEMSLLENNKKTLMMFMSSGCRSCKETEEIIKNNIEFLQEKMNVVTVRPDFDLRQDFDKYYEVDPEQIYFNIFVDSQGVDASDRQYPFFYILNSDYSVEKLIRDPNELIKYVSGL